MRYLSKLFILLGVSMFQCATPYKAIPIASWSDKSVLIQNVNIFNGKDSTLELHKDVLVSGGKITKIREGNTLLTMDYHIVNGEGKTLMPGLVDAHVHLTGSGAVPWANVKADVEYNLASYLYAGVTTIYDLGGMASELSKYTSKVERKDIIGPQIFYTHIPITVKNSHPIPLAQQMLPGPMKGLVNVISPTIEDPAEAGDLVTKYLKHEVDYVKLICDQIPPGSPEMSFEQMKALIAAAHAKNKKVFVHIGSPQNAVDAVNAGADVLAHGIWRGRLSEAQADIIAKSGVPIIYTLAAFNHVNDINQGHFQPSIVEKKLVPKEVLDPVTMAKGNDVHAQPVMNEFFADVTAKSPDWQHNFDLLKARGVPMITGTDSSLPGTYAGGTYLAELDALKAYGLSNYQILKGATYLPSRLFLVAPEFGLVKEGYQADLLLVNGNPLTNLDLVKTPELIIARGRAIERRK